MKLMSLSLITVALAFAAPGLAQNQAANNNGNGGTNNAPAISKPPKSLKDMKRNPNKAARQRRPVVQAQSQPGQNGIALNDVVKVNGHDMKVLGVYVPSTGELEYTASCAGVDGCESIVLTPKTGQIYKTKDDLLRVLPQQIEKAIAERQQHANQNVADQDSDQPDNKNLRHKSSAERRKASREKECAVRTKAADDRVEACDIVDYSKSDSKNGGCSIRYQAFAEPADQAACISSHIDDYSAADDEDSKKIFSKLLDTAVQQYGKLMAKSVNLRNDRDKDAIHEYQQIIDQYKDNDGTDIIANKLEYAAAEGDRSSLGTLLSNAHSQITSPEFTSILLPQLRKDAQPIVSDLTEAQEFLRTQEAYNHRDGIDSSMDSFAHSVLPESSVNSAINSLYQQALNARRNPQLGMGGINGASSNPWDFSQFVTDPSAANQLQANSNGLNSNNPLASFGSRSSNLNFVPGAVPPWVNQQQNIPQMQNQQMRSTGIVNNPSASLTQQRPGIYNQGGFAPGTPNVTQNGQFYTPANGFNANPAGQVYNAGNPMGVRRGLLSMVPNNRGVGGRY